MKVKRSYVNLQKKYLKKGKSLFGNHFYTLHIPTNQISQLNKPERVQPIKSRLIKFESRNFLGINENVISSI